MEECIIFLLIYRNLETHKDKIHNYYSDTHKTDTKYSDYSLILIKRILNKPGE